MWFLSDEDYFDQESRGLDLEDSIKNESESHRCGCRNRRIEMELVDLVSRLQEGSLGQLRPSTMMLADVFYAGLRFGSHGSSWMNHITSPRSIIERHGSVVALRLGCLAGHASSAYWTLSSGWRVLQQESVRMFNRRDSKVARIVKDLHDSICQACCAVLETSNGRLAQAAHIWEVKDGGPDVLENLLCPCPNCHALFDARAWRINFDGASPMAVSEYGGVNSELRTVGGHSIDQRFVKLRLGGQVAVDPGAMTSGFAPLVNA